MKTARSAKIWAEMKPHQEKKMASITGFGGVILYSNDPKRLIEWYKTHLGIDFGTEAYTFFYWREKENSEKIGKTLVEIVPPDNDDHIIDQSKSPVMVSFCVDNLSDILASLRQIDIKVCDEIRDINDGIIGWFYDIDGNKIELWQQK